MTKKSVYLETSFISYLTGRPSRDVVIAGHQATTQDWWETEREHYDLYVSEVVLEEAEKGHLEAANQRLAIIEQLDVLTITEEVGGFAERLLEKGLVPLKASQDALHISAACIHNMDYLLTWNCRHIANVNIRHKIEQLFIDYGYAPSFICTPEELMEDDE